MANVLVNDLYLGDIADAIRSKLGVQTTYKPSEMANAIGNISGGGSIPVINSLSVTENGTYTAPSGVDGYSPITVNVPSGGATLQSKSNINPTTSSQTITPDSGYDGLSSVQINAMPTQSLPSSTSSSATGTQKAVIGKSTSSQYLNVPTGYNDTAQYYNILPMDLNTLSISENGTYNASTYDLDGFSSVTVNVSGGGGSGITRETVEYTLTSNSYTANVPVQGDTSKALFAHFYDKDATYTTANTTYEGIIIGPALVHYQAMLDSKQWSIWRTNAAGSTTGINNYAGSNAVFQTNIVVIAGNPILKADHTYVVDVFYAP